MKNTPASQFLTLSALLRDSYAPRSEGRFSFRGHLLDRPMVNRREIRLCPHCILEDHDREGALGRYGRSYWQLTQFRTCPRHGTPITSLPAQRYALDFAPVVERNLESIRQNAGAVTVRQHSFESWLLHRLAGQRTDYWFDDLEISVVAQFCEKAGIALCFGGATAPGQLEDGQLAIATETAFQRLAARTTGVEPLFREIWTKSCSTRAGYYATFGHLWRWLDKVKADPRYERILSKAADFVFSHQPIPAGTLLLGRECRERRCHSVNSAAAAHGLNTSRTNRLLKKLAEQGKALAADEVDILLSRISNYLPRVKAAKRVGVRPGIFDRLKSIGLLTPAFTTEKVADLY